MARSLCTSCGLRDRYCQCRQALTVVNANADENGERAFKLSFCVSYLIYFVLVGLAYFLFVTVLIMTTTKSPCYLEVFANSFSVTNASNTNATADWNIGFTTMTPGNKFEVSLHTIKSRLFRGNKLISESSTPDYFGLIVAGKINEIPVSNTVFKTVETPRSGVVCDLRVEVMSSIKIKGRHRHGDGFLTVTCDGIPVNFTTDSTGDLKGSLLGYMRQCEYLFRQEFLDSSI